MRSACSSVSPTVFTGAQHTLMRQAHKRRRQKIGARLSQVLQLSEQTWRRPACCVDSAITELQGGNVWRSEEHTSELQSLAYLVCRLLLEKKKKKILNIKATCTRKRTRLLAKRSHTGSS